MTLSLTSLTLTPERKETMVHNVQGMKGYSDTQIST